MKTPVWVQLFTFNGSIIYSRKNERVLTDTFENFPYPDRTCHWRTPGTAEDAASVDNRTLRDAPSARRMDELNMESHTKVLALNKTGCTMRRKLNLERDTFSLGNEGCKQPQIPASSGPAHLHLHRVSQRLWRLVQSWPRLYSGAYQSVQHDLHKRELFIFFCFKTIEVPQQYNAFKWEIQKNPHTKMLNNSW